MRSAIACLLLSGLLGTAAGAGEPVAVASQSFGGDGWARFAMDGEAAARPVQIDLRFGPLQSCYLPSLAADEFSIDLSTPSANLGLRGRYAPGKGGRVTLALDPESLEQPFRNVAATLCELTAPELCADAHGSLEPRLARSRLQLRTRPGGVAANARLRGRLELELVDAQTGEPAFAWTVAFREVNLLSTPTPQTWGFCGSYWGGAFVQLPDPSEP